MTQKILNMFHPLGGGGGTKEYIFLKSPGSLPVSQDRVVDCHQFEHF